MSKLKIKAWLDSGANAASTYEVEFEVDADEWNAMTDDEKYEYAKEYAFERSEWGWNAIGAKP